MTGRGIAVVFERISRVSCSCSWQKEKELMRLLGFVAMQDIDLMVKREVQGDNKHYDTVMVPDQVIGC